MQNRFQKNCHAPPSDINLQQGSNRESTREENMTILCVHWSFMWFYDDILIKAISHSVGNVIKLYLHPGERSRLFFNKWEDEERNVRRCKKDWIKLKFVSVKLGEVTVRHERGRNTKLQPAGFLSQKHSRWLERAHVVLSEGFNIHLGAPRKPLNEQVRRCLFNLHKNNSEQHSSKTQT